jgi:alpha-tubulin suppressor-like RCC1 family protein
MKKKTFFTMMFFLFLLITLSACDNGSSFSNEYIGGIGAISAGDSHTVALKNDGTVFAWGLNDYGQLGDGTYTNSSTPVPVRAPEVSAVTSPVRGLTGITAISARGYRTLALRNDGTVWAWGYNVGGELGDGTHTNRNVPVQVSGLTGITAISAGELHSLALRNDGTVWVWGKNYYGQFGDGTTTNSDTPVQISGLTDVKVISAGAFNTIALKNDGTVWAWGLNSSGQLGNGTMTDSFVPVQVSDLTDVIAISAGFVSHAIALKNDGTVWAWGRNGYGQLGNGTMADSSIPVQVSDLTDVIAISAGDSHTVALRNNGTVWAWGYNNHFQLGDGTSTNRNAPVQVIGLRADGIAITAGGWHTVAIKNNHTVWAWGLNFSGQLGDGTTIDSYTPIQVRW